MMMMMRTTVNVRGSHDTYTFGFLVCRISVCARTQEGGALAHLCVLLKVVLSSDRKLIV